MTPEALSLLETPTVRKLVATWPSVTGATRVEIIRSWSKVSAVHFKIVAKWYDALLANKVIEPNGQIDTLAQEYITTVAMSRCRVTKERTERPRGRRLDS